MKGDFIMLTFTINCLTIVVLNIWGFSKIRKGALIIQRRRDAERLVAAQCIADRHTADNIIPKDDENCKQFMRAG